VKTCAVLTPRLGQSLDPVMAQVQEPQIRTLGIAESFCLRPTKAADCTNLLACKPPATEFGDKITTGEKRPGCF
jgi:hypothetical protein